MRVVTEGELLSAEVGDKWVKGELLFRSDRGSMVVRFFGEAGNGLDAIADEPAMQRIESEGEVFVSKGQLSYRLLTWERSAR